MNIQISNMEQFPSGKHSFIHTQISRMKNSDHLDQLILHDQIINNLIRKYFNENIDKNDFNGVDSKLLFDRYNICHKILTNTKLVYDKESVKKLFDLCPNDYVRITVQIDFHTFDPLDPKKCKLDTLEYLKLRTSEKILHSRTLERFRNDLNQIDVNNYSKTVKIKLYLDEIHDEIHTDQN